VAPSAQINTQALQSDFVQFWMLFRAIAVYDSYAKRAAAHNSRKPRLSVLQLLQNELFEGSAIHNAAAAQKDGIADGQSKTILRVPEKQNSREALQAKNSSRESLMQS
jgi:hypothetical protein